MSSFSPEFVAWPSIGALNTVIRARAKASLSSSSAASSFSSSGRPREEDEEDWASAWQSRLTGASFNYRAKIKLHGSNAAVTLFSGGFRVQSRTRFIDDENKGMSGWVKRHADYWSGQWDRMRSSLLHCSDRTFSEAACCTVFGEWCGPGVQKGSVVAVEQIPEHIFAVFAILVGDLLLIEPQQISNLLSSSSSSSSTPSYPPNLHVLPWLSFDPLLLSFSSSSSSSAPFAEAITRMNSIVEAIEEEDPFISHIFNIKGPGEGAVWYPLLEQEWSWYWQNALPRSLFGALSFKTKGTLHQMTKSSLKRHQTTKERKTTSPVKWQTELVSNEDELVEMFVTSARLLQAFNEVIQDQEEDEEFNSEKVKRRMTEWLVKDIKKESVAERELARSTLGCSIDDWTKVSSLIHQRVQSWSSSSSSQHLFQQQQRTTSKTEEKIRSNENGGNKSLFRGLCFCFSDAVSFGDKSKWTKLIKEHGGNTSYFLSFKNCQYLIATEEEVRNVIHPQKQERQQHKRGKVWDALQFLQQQNGESGNLRASLSSSASSASSSSQKFMIVDTKFVEKSVESGKLEEFEHDLLRRLKKEEGDITSREIEQKLSDREAIKNLPKALVWSYGKSSDEPKFPEHNYEVVKMDVLQCMDFKANNNKFYVMELHASNDYNMYSSNDGDEGTYFLYRIFTHHGRTDELETKKNCAQRECRYLRTLNEAEVLYDFVLATKLANDKGYKKVDLVSVSPNIVSPKLQKEKLQKEEDVNSFSSQQRQQQPTSTLPKPVQQLVQLLYKEASESVTRTVIARITTDGIETPLGILSLTQIQRGEDVLLELSHLAMQPESSERDEQVEKLSQEFYSMIPHRLGTNKAEVRRAILSSPQLIEEKQNLLQLMRDIISVSNARSREKNMAEIDKMYNALECDIRPLKQDSPQYRSISEHFLNRPSTTTPQLRIEGIYALKQQTSSSSSTSSFLRSSSSSSSSFGSNLLSSFWDEGGESEDRGRQSEERLLFHGSRLSNYVGLLSRGILLPKVIVSQGITSRTDFGFLGAGIYFSENSYASLKYTTPLPPPASSSSTQVNHSNKKKNKNNNNNNDVNNKEKEEELRLMLLVNVKLGRMKDFVKITPHLVEPPAGYDSCHGVKHGSGDPPVESDFKEDEYVVYDAARQKLAYLVAFLCYNTTKIA